MDTSVKERTLRAFITWTNVSFEEGYIMANLQAILQYQEVDTKLYKIEREIAGCDERKEYVKVKKFLAAIMQEELSPIRERRKEFEKDIPAVYEMLRKGCEVARETASATLDEVRRAMKINYFDDADLIAEQIKRFSQE